MKITRFTPLLTLPSRRHRRRGAITVLMAILLPVLLALAAFSVDVAYMQLSRAELRAATDSAARAGGEALTRLQDVDLARAVAKDFASRNIVAGEPLILADSDIVFGNSTSDGTKWTFTPNKNPINSLRVTGRRTADSPSGPVGLFFGPAIGTASFQPTMPATVVKLDRDICLVIDRSSSMKFDLSVTDDGKATLSNDDYCSPPKPNTRWFALSSAVQTFIKGVEATDAVEQLSMVSYASNNVTCGQKSVKSSIDQDLTKTYGEISSALGNYSTDGFNGMTNITAGITDGITVLTDKSKCRRFAYKTMILFTDGNHNQGAHPLVAADKAAKENIVIHTITFSAAANQGDMKAVADATNGKHYHAPDSAALDRIFAEIAAGTPVTFSE